MENNKIKHNRIGRYIIELEKVFWNPIEGKFTIQILGYSVGDYWRRKTGRYDIEKTKMFVSIEPNGIKHIESLEKEGKTKEDICIEIEKSFDIYVEYAFQEMYKENISIKFMPKKSIYRRLINCYDIEKNLNKVGIPGINLKKLNSIIYLPY